MKRFITLIVVLLIHNLSSAQEFNQDYQEGILTIINCIKNEDIESIKTLVRFPLRREYPLPDIKNESEFIHRYKEIFDDSLVNKIVNSDIKDDWSIVKWRKVMFDHGALWLDYYGKIIAVNYQSEVERNKRKKLIESDKKLIHSTLRHFEQPKLLLETEKFRIRIDELGNGVFRYASWSIESSINEKPELVIENGNWMPEGNGGNNKYEFINGDYIYECSINVVGTDETPPADLTVYKNEKEILYQAAKIIRN